LSSDGETDVLGLCRILSDAARFVTSCSTSAFSQ
jgi:hypothetical protein